MHIDATGAASRWTTHGARTGSPTTSKAGEHRMTVDNAARTWNGPFQLLAHACGAGSWHLPRNLPVMKHLRGEAQPMKDFTLCVSPVPLFRPSWPAPY
jgi:hypothetical protein